MRKLLPEEVQAEKEKLYEEIVQGRLTIGQATLRVISQFITDREGKSLNKL